MSDAREHLRAALGTFEFLGAVPWAERARTKLRASGEPLASENPGPSDDCPSRAPGGKVRRRGLLDKAVAAQLMLSPRTIDAHLRSVLTKLEITSRKTLPTCTSMHSTRPPNRRSPRRLDTSSTGSRDFPGWT